MGRPGQQDTRQIRLGNTDPVSVVCVTLMRKTESTCSGGTGDDQLRHVVKDWWWMGGWRDSVLSVCHCQRVYISQEARAAN